MVNDNIKIAVLGGDRRQIYAIGALAESGKHLSVMGLTRELFPERCAENISFEDDVGSALHEAPVVLLPVPASTDGVRINCPLDRSGSLADIKLLSLAKRLDAGTTVIGGKLPDSFVLLAEERGIRVCDMIGVPAFEIKNAYITAEAALSVAMNSLSKNVCGARVAVTGFGRIAKHLARLLSLLGASVTVAARKDSDLAFAGTLGYSCVKIAGERWSDALLCGYDIVYNTVPHTIFDREFLRSIDKRTLLVELASVPGGFDICAAQELGTSISWALSLPGKYAPESAGAIIAECVEALMAKEADGV